ncbi:MAG: hypothetical protein M8364_19220 [Methylobacter sp.]|uniref:hypothetical protein n=1 Tax=Methylobacter sp. TaxID=2051955 RepID=UPI002586B885|nr:hypothetical protein [Methylobacter sp.]MCL7423027.1 hypothetical protein [Methylobacter sp.]
MSDIIKAPTIIAVLQDLARDVKSWERGGHGKEGQVLQSSISERGFIDRSAHSGIMHLKSSAICCML